MYEGGKIKVKGIDYNKDKEYEIETYYKSPNGNNKWQIPIVNPIQFERNDILPIDPYLLGLGLGDGSFNKKNIRFSVHKDDYDGLFVLLNLKENKPQGNKRNGYINVGLSLYELGIEHTRSINKFIPDIYKYSSIENRLSILQGLMDTDGHCMFNGNETFLGTEFCTISKQLCDDVVEVVQTLGGVARVKTRIPTYTYKGVKKEGKLAYRVNIKLPLGMNPFRLKRKSERYIEPKKYPTGRYIKNIEKVGFEESVCISVDSPDKLYVTEHCIVTHNTTSTIIAALETKVKKILIVCPASLKINWQREIENYSSRTVYIAEGKKFSMDHDIVIINYDILKNFHDIKNKENSEILKSKFDLVIMDESHMISNPQAARTKIINDISTSIDRVWLLTGTPMTSRPMNYFNLLSLVESPVATNWMAYARRYCNGFQFSVGKRKVWNVTGASNLDELRERTQSHILRRLKDEVLDLPDKIITPVYLRLKSKDYEELMGEYFNWYDNNSEESSSLTIQFGKLMKVRKIIAQEKVKNTIELAENIIEQGKKVIIFTNFTDTLQEIYNHFGKQAVYLDGSCSKPHRQKSVDDFQENDKIRVFIGNLKAAGVGITLTSAEAVIMNDLSFVPAEHAQAEDRSHRIGQKNSTSVYYPLFENTIEGAIYDILNRKKKIISTVMGDDIMDEASSIEEMLNMISKDR
jgi:ribosome biogenesis protein Nip4